MTTTADNPSARAVSHAVKNAEAQRAGLLPADAKRDVSERAGGSYLIVGESPIDIWRRPMSQRLARQLEDEGLEAYSAQDSAPDAPVAIIRADHFFDRAAAYVLLREMPSVITMPAESTRVTPVAAFVPGSQVTRWRELLEAGVIEASSLPPDLIHHDGVALPEIYNSELRKMTRPFVSPINETTINEIERRTFNLAYKGVTDFVTKYVYPTPAYYGTRLAARLGMSPNALTSISLMLVFLTMYLFATGQQASGIAVGFVMSFFDTLDGKLARVTVTSTEWGGYFDHAIDLIHPPFWWFAFWWGVAPQPVPESWNLAAGLTFFFYTAVRVLEWRFKRRYSVRIHTWQPFDSHFRSFTTRRNPNLVILGACLLVADAQVGVYAVLAWMIASFAIHAVRMVQAEIHVRTTGPLRSWFEQS